MRASKRVLDNVLAKREFPTDWRRYWMYNAVSLSN
jgi:hypothetical protein